MADHKVALRTPRARLGALLALAAVLPAVEAAILAVVGFQAARGLSPQITAVWPYGTYHELRWLFVYHQTIPGFILAFVALSVLRGVLSAAFATLAWPTGTPCPSWQWLLRRNIWVAVLTAVILSPWVALSMAFATTALSWYLLASVLPLLLLAPFLLRAGVVADWWRGLPRIGLVGWAWLNFAVLTFAGALLASVPFRWGVPLAAGVGVVNGLLWRQSVAIAVAPGRVHWRLVPMAPLTVVLTLAALPAVQPVAGYFQDERTGWRPPIIAEPLPDNVPFAVIAIAGHDSEYDGEPAADPRVERYSYRGLDGQDRPIPYTALDTHISLGESAALLAAHVDSLHRRTKRPVALLGHSEGAMVARTYLEKWPQTEVEAALLFSPLVMPGRTYYPPRDIRQGWGVVAGWELRALMAWWNLTDVSDETPDQPFIRSLLADAPFYRNRTLCPVAGVRMVAFLPTVSAIEAPPGEYSRIPVFELPALHGGLLNQAAVADRVLNFLAGEPVERAQEEYALLQRLGAAWQPPPLALRLNPVWSANREADPAFTGKICEAR
ncbi:alpha/beta hydrolase [Micromonospora sp. WMMA1363]|uniref:serine aminopeptidase domain-containing protein n=1 Tax=Micromonospora sp. WMMA1363 TaxID=3053985 RepID=UPI00259CAE1D|nr:alpha/beta hydrolase [Micromonospora sp. WMMA1363]MDM4718128.1 alpha/beta hydrolase [Micromonospora sp. WMMA1363]